MGEPFYDTVMGHGPKKVIHWEHWSCPDAETYLTGIDYYDHPKLCRERLKQLYPQLGLGVPEKDDPKPRPRMGAVGVTADHEKHTVRWGEGETGSFVHGDAFFKTPEDVFAFSPLTKADFRDWGHVVMAWDFTSEPFTDYKAIARRYDNPFVAGEGDNRILLRNKPEEIKAMVKSMVETGKMSGGYMMCVGNHIPWNVPGPAIKLYLDLSAEMAYR